MDILFLTAWYGSNDKRYLLAIEFKTKMNLRSHKNTESRKFWKVFENWKFESFLSFLSFRSLLMMEYVLHGITFTF